MVGRTCRQIAIQLQSTPSLWVGCRRRWRLILRSHDRRRLGQRPNTEIRVNLGRQVDHAILHHHTDFLDCFQILDRVPGDQEKIRQFAALDRTQLLVLTQIHRHIVAAAAQCFGGTEANRLKQLKLAMKAEGAAKIGAGNQQHSALTHHPQRLENLLVTVAIGLIVTRFGKIEPGL